MPSKFDDFTSTCSQVELQRTSRDILLLQNQLSSIFSDKKSEIVLNTTFEVNLKKDSLQHTQLNITNPGTNGHLFIKIITKKDSDKVKTNLKIYVSFTLKEPNATAYDKMLTNVSKYISLSP